MTLLRIAPAILAALPLLAGCSTSLESTQQYEGTTTAPQSASYVSGTGLTVRIHGGNIRSGEATSAVQITGGGPPGVVSATFTPIEQNTAEKQSTAQDEMTNDLVYVVSQNADGSVSVEVDFKNGSTHESSLSAIADIILPSDFNGPIDCTTEDGDITIGGDGWVAPGGILAHVTSGVGNIEAHGGVGNYDVFTGNGDIRLSTGIELGTETGAVKTEFGNIQVDFATGANVSLQAVSSGDGLVTNRTGAPENDASPQSIAVTLNNGSTNTWQIDASQGVGTSILLDVD